MKKKDLIEISITSVLGIVLILLLVHNLTKKKQVPVPISAGPTVATTSIIPQKVKTEGLYNSLGEQTKDIVLTRDPFFAILKEVPPEKETAVKLRLNGILFGQGVPKAIINGNVVVEGDVIYGNTVVDIKKKRVILNDGIHNFELTLEPVSPE